MSLSELANSITASGEVKHFEIGNGTSLPVLSLDGGMGTALELMGLTIEDSPLWSASAIEKAPEAIVKAHLDYLEAGADIIITNTYVDSMIALKGQFCKTTN